MCANLQAVCACARLSKACAQQQSQAHWETPADLSTQESQAKAGRYGRQTGRADGCSASARWFKSSLRSYVLSHHLGVTLFGV